MTEESKNDKYIICSKCRSKYINDEEHINKDFGYTRLEERYKTCVRCRARNKINGKTYYEAHKEEQQEVKKEHSKQYRETNADKVKEKDRARDQIKAYCPHCNSEIGARKLNRHLQSQKCKKKPHPNDNYILVGGRIYLKGESPLEGVWHADHTPFEVKRYVIFENGVERGVTITTI